MKTPSERRRARRRAQFAIDLVLTVGIAVAVAVVIRANWPPPPPPPIPLPEQPVALDGAATKGHPSARVALIEYSDFQCPHCGTFARETLPVIDRQYVTDANVLLVHRHLAPPTHPRALPAAIAAECAALQGRFWEMHDRLFTNQAKLDDATLLAHAVALGLDMLAFEACRADATIADRIARDTAEARRLRITGTPAFFIGMVQPDGRVLVTRSLRGAVPVAELQDALDAVMADAVPATLFSLRHPAGRAGAGITALGIAAALVFAVRQRRRLQRRTLAPTVTTRG